MTFVRSAAVAFGVALRRAGWAPLVVFAVHVLTATWIDVYARWPDFDVPMHVLGGGAIALFLRAWAGELERDSCLGAPSATARGLLVMGLTAIVAIGWECAEFLSDRLLLSRWSTEPADLLADLVLGLVGACVVVTWFAVRERR